MSPSSATSAPDRICIVRLSAIGDTCHALAVVRNLQDNWPDTHVTWIIGRTEAALLGDIEDVEFIIFDKSRGLSAYSDFRRGMRGRRFDVALCMHASLRANLLYPTIDAPARIGFDRQRARDFQWLFTNRRIDHVEREHALDAMMGFARHIGAADTRPRWDIPIPDAAREFAGRFTRRPMIAISPCSSERARNFRNWDIGNYIAVARHIADRHDGLVVLTGGPGETERHYADAIAGETGAVDLVGRTSLKQLLAILAAADGLVCPDSGPVHIATAVGTPVVGLYATSNPGRTGPYRAGRYTVNRYPEAVRRYLGADVDEIRWGRRVRHPDAMSLITVEDVIAKIDDIFR